MRVGFLFLHPFSSSLGSTVRLRELTNHLSKFNVESFIFTPYEKSQVLSEGVKVVSVGGLLQEYGLSIHLYKLTKFMYYNSFFIKYFMTSKTVQDRFAKNNASSILKALKLNPVEIIQVEQDFALPTAIEVKNRTGLPLVVDLHNITSEELVASGAIKPNSKEFCKLQEMLRKGLKQVDAIVVVSDLMKEYVVNRYGLSPDRIYVVPPGASSVSLEINVPKRLRVVYSGLVSYREHVDLFVRSMPLIQEKIKNVEFYITDKGEDLKKTKKLAKQLNVNPVFFWYPNKSDFTQFLSSCDVAVLPSSNDLARQMGTPAKLFEYLSAGLPIVASSVGAWANIIDRENVGIIADDDPQCFAEAIIKLLQNDKLRSKFSKNAKHAANTSYLWNNSANTLNQIFINTITNYQIA